MPALGLGGGDVQGPPPTGTAWPQAAGLPGCSPSRGSVLLSETAARGVCEAGGVVAEGADGDVAALQTAQWGE